MLIHGYEHYVQMWWDQQVRIQVRVKVIVRWIVSVVLILPLNIGESKCIHETTIHEFNHDTCRMSKYQHAYMIHSTSITCASHHTTSHHIPWHHDHHVMIILTNNTCIQYKYKYRWTNISCIKNIFCSKRVDTCHSYIHHKNDKKKLRQWQTYMTRDMT